jgi:hypothetical protein
VSIQHCEVLLDNETEAAQWFNTRARVALKLFVLAGLHVSVLKNRSLCTRYKSDTLDSYIIKIKRVLRDN